MSGGILNAEAFVDIEGFDIGLDEIIMDIDAHEVKAVAATVRDKAQATSAFIDRSGKLRDSITMRKSKFEDGGYIVVAKDPKAHLIEWGHVKILWGKITGERVPAKSFMRKALEETVSELGG